MWCSKRAAADALIPDSRLYNAGDLRAQGELSDGFRALREMYTLKDPSHGGDSDGMVVAGPGCIGL